jgi:hypothetical protein
MSNDISCTSITLKAINLYHKNMFSGAIIIVFADYYL